MGFKVVLALAPIALSLACASNNGGTAAVTSDATAIRSAPAGTATLAFLDMEASVRPDALPTLIPLPPAGDAMGLAPAAAGAVPACVTATTVGKVITFTYKQCVAAGTGSMSGTLTATATALAGGGTSYAEVFDLTSVVDASHSWHYTGTQTVVINGSSATVSTVPATALQAAYTDSAVPANSKTFVFNPALTVSWATAGQVVLSGSYSFTQTGVQTIQVAIDPSNPLVLSSGCEYPNAGGLTLTLSGSLGNASTTASFGPACGQLTISGGKITLGSH